MGSTLAKLNSGIKFVNFYDALSKESTAYGITKTTAADVRGTK